MTEVDSRARSEVLWDDANDSDKAIRAALDSGDPMLAVLGAIACHLRSVADALYHDGDPIALVVDRGIGEATENLDKIRGDLDAIDTRIAEHS